MRNYCDSYIKVLKRNYMLLFIASVMLVVTFFIWAGIPVFIIGSAVSDLTANHFIIQLCISLSVAIILSLYFLAINIKVAQDMAATKKRSLFNAFIRIELFWIIGIALIIQAVIIMMTL